MVTLRICLYFAALLAVLIGGTLYMCRCYHRPHKAGTPVTISPDHLKAHVHKLGGEIGERNIYQPKALRRAADYIESVWRAQSYEVVQHPYDLQGEKWANLEVTRLGKTRPTEIILVGAHYDSVTGSPGANDNATGVAALLALSAKFRDIQPSRTVRFVAFVNEEPPFFESGQMGSRVYARMARQRGDAIRAMMSLETMGCYSDQPGSQNAPGFFGLLYPAKGNFIAFVSNLGSRAAMHDAFAGFRGHSTFPAECIATFKFIIGVGWSDHQSFWREGYRAFMVTDTAPFRYPHYHTAQDTPDKVNFDALARVTEGVFGSIMALTEK